MDIQVISSPVTIVYVAKLAQKQFGDIIKATVDESKGIMALGGELHADEEQLLLKNGSSQQDLWGINLYPLKFGLADFIEFDSMINIRPSQGNMSRDVEDAAVQQRIRDIVNKLVVEKMEK